MVDSVRGEAVFHELSKLLALRGFSTSKPNIDKVIDMIATKNNKIGLIQIKTVIFNLDQEKKLVNASGSKNGKFSERYSGLNLVVVCLDKEGQNLYNLIFPPSKLPDIQCLTVRRRRKDVKKYEEFLDNFEKRRLEKTRLT